MINRYLKIVFFVLYCAACPKMLAQVGINTNTPLSTLDINGNLSLKALGVSPTINGGPSGNATPINNGVYLSLTPTAGNVEFIVPSAVAVPGRIYILRNISNSVTAQLYSLGGNFFAKDSNTATAAPLNMPANAALKTIILISDGANWTYIF